MRAVPGPLTLVVALGTVCVVLTGCTDDTGAIDQKGHNGYDKRACTDLVAMADDVTHDAVTASQASAEAETIAATSDRAGDPTVRQAGDRLRAAYRANDPGAAVDALAEFAAACAW